MVGYFCKKEKKKKKEKHIANMDVAAYTRHGANYMSRQIIVSMYDLNWINVLADLDLASVIIVALVFFISWLLISRTLRYAINSLPQY